MRRALVLTAMLAVASGCAGAEAGPVSSPIRPAADAVPVYQLTVTNPGTRSQGVRGTLYAADGTAIAAGGDPFSDAPMPQPADTPVGHFEWVRCANLWSVCGYQRMQPGETRSGIDNQVTIGGVTDFRIVRVPGANAPAYRGELLDSGKLVTPKGDRAETPLGPMVRHEGLFMGMQWHGWLPAAWLARERIYYEETIEALGSKSEHMSGNFYDEQGRPANPFDLLPVETPIGAFVSVAGSYPWDDAGMFHQRGMQTFVSPADNANPVTVTTFRVVIIPGNPAPSFRGELLDGWDPVNPKGERVATTLGPMVRIDGSYNGHHWNGWIPVTWLPPQAP